MRLLGWLSSHFISASQSNRWGFQKRKKIKEYFTPPSFTENVLYSTDFWLLFIKKVQGLEKRKEKKKKPLELCFNGYSQPALCHYWPRVELGDLPNLWHNQASLCITPYTPRSLHITPLNHTLFSARLIAGGLTQDSPVPLFSSPIQIPALNSKRDFRAFTGMSCQGAQRGGGARGFWMFSTTTQAKTCCKQDPEATAALPWLLDSWNGPNHE